jgi:ribosome-associated translation inhibitor RaiA
MQTELRITFRHMDPSAAVEARVREFVAHLEKIDARIISCHVVIDVPPAHRETGAPFSARINLELPEHSAVFDSTHGHQEGHADVYIALRDVFDAATRAMTERRSSERRSDLRAKA